MSESYVTKPHVPVGSRDAVPAELLEDFPAIAQVLGGRTKDQNGGELPPHSIVFFLDGGKLKFCLTSKQSCDIAFGTVDDVSKPWEALEAALRGHQYEWKVRRR